MKKRYGKKSGFGKKKSDQPEERKDEERLDGLRKSATKRTDTKVAPEEKSEPHAEFEPKEHVKVDEQVLSDEGLVKPIPRIREEEISDDASLEAGEIEEFDEEDFVIPEHLQEYISELDSPDAIKLMPSKWWGSTSDFHKRVEEYAERIAIEMHELINPRALLDLSHDELEAEVIRLVEVIAKHKVIKLSEKDKEGVVHVITDDLIGLGPLQDLLEDDEIADIMVDGPEEVYIERNGIIEKTDINFRSDRHLMNICQRIANRVGRHVDAASPLCDARLEDGSRVNIVIPPLALNGATVTIRKFKRERLTLDKLLEIGTVDARVEAFLQLLAACRVNLIVSGGTGSGKTTLLNCLTRYISPTERIITCEDCAELQLQQPQVVSLESRPPNIEGLGQVTMRELVRNSLRMRPDRIIVGEVRGPEAFDLMQAMNTGHDGCMSTLHANSAKDALFRLENMVVMANLNLPVSVIREQLASSLEVIVQVKRLRDGSRKVVGICEVLPMSGGDMILNDLVTYEITNNREDEKIDGEYKWGTPTEDLIEKAAYFNMDKDLHEIFED